MSFRPKIRLIDIRLRHACRILQRDIHHTTQPPLLLVLCRRKYRCPGLRSLLNPAIASGPPFISDAKLLGLAKMYGICAHISHEFATFISQPLKFT